MMPTRTVWDSASATGSALKRSPSASISAMPPGTEPKNAVGASSPATRVWIQAPNPPSRIAARAAAAIQWISPSTIAVISGVKRSPMAVPIKTWPS